MGLGDQMEFQGEWLQHFHHDSRILRPLYFIPSKSQEDRDDNLPRNCFVYIGWG